jgi:predicted RNA-binding protein (virulence factor B family)
MSSNIKLGRYNKLLIDKESQYGLYLKSSDGEDILLPNAYVKSTMKLEDEIEVFVYRDSEDRLTATTLKPHLCVGEFALLEVVDSSEFGAFIDIGLPKDVLVPKKMQKNPLKVGKKYIFALSIDSKSDRLIADSRIHRYLNGTKESAKHLKAVDLLVIAKTPMGYKVVVNSDFEGMIYNNEIFEDITIGQKLKGFVKNIRDDGKLDISLNPMGKSRVDFNSKKILDILTINSGKLPYNYKSDAKDIKKVFSMSKKAYKESLTKLIDNQKIELSAGGIKVI